MRRGRPRARCASSPSITPPICCAPIGKWPRRSMQGSEDALIGHVVKAMPRVGAVVLSDYAKGALTPRVIRAVIEAANAAGKPVVVDPKGRDYGIYRGATLITPNRQELADATAQRRRRPTTRSPRAAAELGRELGAEAVLVTRSEAGMTLVSERRGRPRAGLSGARARRLRRRRHRGGGARGHAGDGRRFRIGDARGQCRRRGGGRQARHRDAVGRRIALAHSAGGDARARGKDRVRLGAARRASRRMAAAGPARRLHQWLLRSAASRPRQIAGRRARAPATGWWWA